MAAHMAPKRTVDDSGQGATIKAMQFGLFSSNEVRSLSEFEIVSDKGYEQPNRIPVVGGVVDRRLGVSDKVNVCHTCGCKMNDCPGHFGHIKFELPIFHIGYLKPTLSVLQIICKCCSRVLLPLPERQKMLRLLNHPMTKGDFVRRAGAFKRVLEACKKVKICPYCEQINGTVRRFGILKYVHEKYPPKMKGEKADNHRRAFYVRYSSMVEQSAGKMHRSAGSQAGECLPRVSEHPRRPQRVGCSGFSCAGTLPLCAHFCPNAEHF